jgi:two-component system, NarL family, nitrate/nitrite response regulator NarL
MLTPQLSFRSSTYQPFQLLDATPVLATALTLCQNCDTTELAPPIGVCSSELVRPYRSPHLHVPVWLLMLRSSSGAMMGDGLDELGRVKVIVLDDRQLLAEAFGTMLGRAHDVEVVGIQSEPHQAVADVVDARPDVVLLDFVTLKLLEKEGALAKMRAELTDLKILAITQSPDEDTLLACVQAGAAGYVTKKQTAAELVTSIKRVHAGEVLFPSTALLGMFAVSQQRYPIAEASHLKARLAPREREVLQTLATGASTGEVAAQLNITVHTVRTHLRSVLSKLEARSKLEAVLVALRAGLIELPE